MRKYKKFANASERYEDFAKWLDEVLAQPVPEGEGCKGICFNLYDDGDNRRSCEIVATEDFDPENDDWGCSEVTDFGTRDKPFGWEEAADWQEVLSGTSAMAAKYLDGGKYADKLKAHEGVGIGFVEGDLEILYKKA